MKKDQINKVFVLGISAVSISCIFIGCSNNTNKTTLWNNERVVLTNLSLNNDKQPILSKNNNKDHKIKKSYDKKKEVSKPSIRLIYQIGFDNDSYRLNPIVIDKNLSEIKSLVKKHKLSVNIIGHSHGISSLDESNIKTPSPNNFAIFSEPGSGIRELSTKRANSVYFYLVKKGFDRRTLKRYATWSGTNEKGVMQKGVEIVLNLPEKEKIKTFVKN